MASRDDSGQPPELKELIRVVLHRDAQQLRCKLAVVTIRDHNGKCAIHAIVARDMTEEQLCS